MREENFKEDLYHGIDMSHKGHTGISVAKLMHFVVCLRDEFEGPGEWEWSDNPPTANQSHASATLDSISPV